MHADSRSSVGSVPTDDSLADDFVAAAEKALSDAFGVQFEFWVSGSPWTRWPATSNGESICEDASLLEILEAAWGEPETPLIREQPDGRHLVAVCCRDASGDGVVGVGTVSAQSPQWLDRLARCAGRQMQLEQTLDLREGDLESCAKQISSDFEALTYLQGLAEHIEVCDISRSAADVAGSVIPLLRDLLNAEALVFVEPEERSGGPRRGTLQVGSVAIWAGRRVIDESTCLELIDRLKEAAASQPVVENHLSRNSQGSYPEGIESFLLTSASTSDACVGWLLALNCQRAMHNEAVPASDGRWDSSDYEFGTVEAGLASSAGIMLATHQRNVELFQDKERLLIGILRALVNAVDAKDSYTCGHSDRVALIAQRLGQELGLENRECEELFLAGLLHDIGKIGVPDRVLLKPGKLTEDEFGLLKEHPERGRRILKHLDHLSYALPGVLHHHEHYDGKGYPSGLVGDKIPLIARIIAVADAYDAMSSNRPYREAMPEEKVETILRCGAGTQWDDRVMEAFFSVLPDIRALCAESESHTRELLALGDDSGDGGSPLVATDAITTSVNATQAQ